jgi:hypothetical protein
MKVGFDETQNREIIFRMKQKVKNFQAGRDFERILFERANIFKNKFYALIARINAVIA